MSNITSIASECLKVYKEIQDLVNYCQKHPDREIVNECVKFCDLNIEKLKLLKKSTFSKTSGQKQACFFTINLLQSLKDDLNSVFVKEGGQLSSEKIKWFDSEVAFEGAIRVGVIKNIRHIDPTAFLNDAKNLFSQEINKILKNLKCNLKVYTVLEAIYVKLDGSEKSDEDLKHFNTKAFNIFMTSNVKELFDEFVISPTLRDMEEFEERKSGWTLKRVELLNVVINKYNAQRCGTYMPLPTVIANKQACINIKSYDEECFKWSILSALAHLEGYRINNCNEVGTYKKFLNVFNLDFSGISFPVAFHDIPRFEAKNNLSINVYTFDSETSEVCPIYLTSDKKPDNRHIRLLALENEYVTNENGENIGIVCYSKNSVYKKRKLDILSNVSRFHYVWIKNISRLLNSQVSRHKGAIFVCDRCLCYLHSKEKLQKHEIICQKLNKCKIVLPSPKNESDKFYKTIQFKNYKFKEKCPFLVVADFESSMLKMNEKQIHEHKPLSVGYYFICRYDDSLSYYRSYVGEDCPLWLMRELKDVAEKVENIMNEPKEIIALTHEQEEEFRNAKICHICEKPFEKGDVIIREHCHLTGRYRGPAHNDPCNLNYKDSRTIPVVFHNLSGYDGHFIINDLANSFEGTVDLIPLNKEKYISFTKHVEDSTIKLRFIDSLRFMSSSLDKLAKNMKELKIVKKFHPNISSEKFELLRRKGIFCYEYIDSVEKLNESQLPPIEQFYSSLTDSHISLEDYQHAQRVWVAFECKTLLDYLLLYMKLDILILADVFLEFCENSLSAYKLDPCHYFTAPGLAWDSMLKCTGVSLELLDNIEMVTFVERGIRGGISQCSNRYSKANNKYMKNFNENEETKYIMYWDVNNLYGFAMEKPLPKGGFRWLNECEMKDLNLDQLTEDSPKGYLYEVDLEYPEEIHDVHKDLPFCPEHSTPPRSKQKKLMTTLFDKKNYVIHYMYLKQALENGLILKKIHAILEFDQEPWLKKYVDLNSQLRQRATNEFEKNFYKLMNNAVYGKTMENVKKRLDVKLISKWDGRYGAEALISKPNFHACTIFNENLIAIEMEKLKVCMNKPIYIGLCVLDISKIVLYEFHYNFAKKQTNSEYKLLYVDTDSLLYEIKGENVYETMKKNIHRFDTSDYPENNCYEIPRVNKKKTGIMKDECSGRVLTKMIGLRSKSYTLTFENEDFVTKSKGVKSSVLKNTINSDHYEDCLLNSTLIYRDQCNIVSKLHKLYTTKTNKLALSPHDDKRFLIKNSTDTLPWGHKNSVSE